ncbi:unnamed protein product [Amoebophrya sp. A120]|nr:unnamed protein product [Amoebophrya sp. A120]|eukprot:GSA120T00009187001.1
MSRMNRIAPSSVLRLFGWVILCLYASMPVRGDFVRELVDSGLSSEQIEKLAHLHQNTKPLPEVCSEFGGRLSLMTELVAVNENVERPQDEQAQVDPFSISEDAASKTASGFALVEIRPRGGVRAKKHIHFDFLYCLFAGLGYDLLRFASADPDDMPPENELFLTSRISQLNNGRDRKALWENFAEKHPETFSWKLYDHLLSLFTVDIWPMITAGVRGYITALQQIQERDAGPRREGATPMACSFVWRASLRLEMREGYYPSWHIDHGAGDAIRFSIPLFGAPTEIKSKPLVYDDAGTARKLESGKTKDGTGYWGGGVRRRV